MLKGQLRPILLRYFVRMVSAPSDNRVPLRSLRFFFELQVTYDGYWNWLIVNIVIWNLEIWNLGIFIDANLVMRTHVQRIILYHDVLLCSVNCDRIQNFVSTATFQTNSGFSGDVLTGLWKQLLIGLPIHLIRRLQSVQNAAARLVCKLRRFDHITDALNQLTLATHSGAHYLQDSRAHI